MIRYTLRCDRGHGFESWFNSSDSYQKLVAADQVTCAICGSARIEKAIMAPAIPARSNKARPVADPARVSSPQEPDQPAAQARPTPHSGQPPVAAHGPLSGPPGEVATALRKLRAKVEAEADYVGRSFADEARKIHLGEADARGIWGEATHSEAKELVEEGIPVAPLPTMRRLDS